MGKNRQPATIYAEPHRDLAEQVGRHRHLALPARMRPDRRQVEMSDPHAEPPPHFGRQRFGLIEFGRIKIYVRVEIVDHGHCRIMGMPVPVSRQSPLASCHERAISELSNT